jgi:hypothetical protein
MKKIKLKYPMKISEILLPRGMVGDVVDIEEVKKDFPTIDYRLESNQIAVKFEKFQPIIVHKDQVEIIKE